MTEHVAAYWGPRGDDPADMAQRLVGVLERLEIPAWYPLGKAEPHPEDAVITDADSLLQMLKAGRNRRDTDNSVIEELSYSLSLWSPEPTGGIKISLRVGITSTVPGLFNSLLINLPAGHELHDRAGEIFTALVAATDPARAIWATREYRRTQATVDGQAMIGWQTYLTAPLTGQLQSIPAGVTVRSLARGSWITAGDEPGPGSQQLAAAIAADLLD